MKFVVFQLDGKNYGVELQYIRSIEKVKEVRELPQTPHFYRGIINMRGEVISIIDLADYFHLGQISNVDENFVLITQYQDLVVGLMVDLATDVIEIDPSSIDDVPSIISEKYIQGILNLEDKMIVLLDIPNILDKDEILISKDLSDLAI
ncbi:chemotaxis protein CheW [Chungangia koreensis]|uniref:Chemotaxis protein CheW n=1 Tax=Chungangia koreensis TaxID=752657 RepID=A0ABV8X8W6_9LACT